MRLIFVRSGLTAFERAASSSSAVYVFVAGAVSRPRSTVFVAAVICAPVTGTGDACSLFGTSFVNGGRWNELAGWRSNAFEPLESIRQSVGFQDDSASWNAVILATRA